MFLLGVPLLIFSFAIYNIVEFMLPGFAWSMEVLRFRLASGGMIAITAGDSMVARIDPHPADRDAEGGAAEPAQRRRPSAVDGAVRRHGDRVPAGEAGGDIHLPPAARHQLRRRDGRLRRRRSAPPSATSRSPGPTAPIRSERAAARRNRVSMFRDFHSPGRSAVMACEGMAATSHPLASEIAIATLRAGGTAADAAVAAVAALGVVEPHMTGIGGDCFCLVAKPGAPLWGYNGSGRSAAAARPEVLIAQGVTAIGFDSVHSVTVPGAVDAWDAVLAAHGRFGLDRALAPAIHHAERGFPVAPRVACDWGGLVERLRADPGASRHYLVDGRAPLPGDIMRFPGAGGDPEVDRGPRAARVLRRRGRRHRRDAGGPRLMAGARGFRAPSRRAGDADRIELSRARRGGTAAQRPGPHRAGAAQYPRELRPRFARSGRAGTPAYRARGGAARLWRARRPCRRPRPSAGRDRGADRQGLCRPTSPRGSTAAPACRCRRRRRPPAIPSM